ncbi:MAG TPA: hypothetical protein VMU84_13870 [Thermoanaerobaculia bacterium]|nr:hypothetical protein [Thermoanaerobaculia bacterium]
MIKITCTNCQKPLSLDETKLPMKEVSFPCPVCKTKLTVDKRSLEGAAPSAAAPQPAAPAPASQPEHYAGDGHEDHEHDFGEKALIVGNDNPALRQAAKLVGFLPVHFAAADKAREYFMQEFPQLVLLNPPQVTQPPIESMQPMISLISADRRKSFLVLVAENLRTLDGNAAFLYGVNLVVAAKDLPQFPQIYRDAHGYHERLYSSMNAVMRAMQSSL